jgi:hypothetical protein
MPVIEISVSVDVRARRCGADVRAFLDFHPEQDLNSEIELRLWPVKGNQWRAIFSVDEPCERFAYRIGIAAHPDASWRMRIRNCNLDVDLLVDSDRLMLPKSWLIGECCVQPYARVLRLPQGRKKIHGS